MTLVILALNTPYFVSWPSTETVYNYALNRNQTVVYCNRLFSVNILLNVLALLTRIYVPFAMMIVLNVFSISKLRKSRHRVQQPKDGTKNSVSHVSPLEYRFTVNSLTMDFIFLGFYLPLMAYYTLNIASVVFDLFDTYMTLSIFDFFANMAQLFAFTFHVIDIFIFLAFNRNFRKHLFKLLKFDWLFNKNNNR